MPNINKKTLDKLIGTLPELYSVISTLQNTIHPHILEKLVKVQDDIDSSLQPFIEAQEQSEYDEIDACDAIKNQHKFSSIWSIHNVKAKDLHKNFSKKIVNAVHYKEYNLSIECNKVMKYIDMWAVADHLINLSQDDHHIFIENFRLIKEGHYELITGS